MAALAKSSLVFFFMAMALVGVCFGAVYKVGDSHGWTDQGHFNYKTWSSNKHFTVEDTLVFEYDAKKEHLVQVDHKDYKECKAKDPLFTFASGNDNVEITMPGDFYISSLHDHCKAGQKLHIRVHASSSTPSPSQTPSFSSTSPSPVYLSPSPTPVASTPSASPSLSPSGSPRPSPTGSPSYNPNGSSSYNPNRSSRPSPRTISRSPPPKPRPTVRPNPPSVPIVVSNPPPPPSPRGTPPTRRKAVITKSQASPSNGFTNFAGFDGCGGGPCQYCVN